MKTQSNYLSPGTEKVLGALRGNAQGCVETRRDGSRWQDVVLTDAQCDVEPGISKSAFAGHLKALTDAGLYHAMDGYFGSVKLEDDRC